MVPTNDDDLRHFAVAPCLRIGLKYYVQVIACEGMAHGIRSLGDSFGEFSLPKVRSG